MLPFATLKPPSGTRGGSRGRSGVVGFCLGGKIAYLAATRTDTDASVSYYGVGIDAYWARRTRSRAAAAALRRA
jgi:dienelactone hydrolase